MAIRAVVLDIGGVLEVVDDDVFPAPAERRLGLAAGSIAGGLAGLPGDAVVGEVTEHQVRAEWQRALALDDRQVDALLDDFWRWYVGTLDRAALRLVRGPASGAAHRDPVQLRSRRARARTVPRLRGRHRRHRLQPRGGARQARPGGVRARHRGGSASRPGRSSSSTTSRPTSSPREPWAGTPSSTATPRRRSPRWSASSRPPRTSDDAARWGTGWHADPRSIAPRRPRHRCLQRHR